MKRGAGVDYDNRLVSQVDSILNPGKSLHVMTSKSHGMRVLNLRMNRLTPSSTGYTGYTRQGFMLTREEARALKNALVEMVDDDDLWDDDDGVVPL